ncbi:MAG TPA: tRNA 2-thiouridine(34) synthase MnmA [Microbacteriaceae bacterium]|nr:tRNA 2-thiouridine(34) synthase MnmA [Microbacteriaceae bacterium]
MKVLVAMSGGVDSSVAAARAVEAGHEVVGVHLALSRHRATLREGSRGCCTVEDAMDARRVADRLGIPFYVWDFSERFAQTVVRDFVDEYAAGRTPNPCLRCNEEIKFAALLDRALALGFDAVATGHYADVVDGPDGLELHRAAAGPKDQSYVLGVLTPEQLAHAYFPLGAAASKDDVRAEAAERGFVTATKPDSYDICFIPDGDTRGYLAERLDLAAGDIVDAEGVVVGAHDGALAFTVGQRRGLNLTVPAADGRPRFVLELRPSNGQVVVGPREALAVTGLAGSRWSALGRLEDALEVQVRAHAHPVGCRVRFEGDEVVIELAEPVEGVASGQSAVLYAGTRVLGQVTIDRTFLTARVGVDA